MSGGASATASVDYEDVTITSDDGTVQHVSIYGGSEVNWNGFERPAQSFTVESHVEIFDSNNNSLWSGVINESGPHDLNNESWGGEGETHTGVGTSGTITSDVGLRSNGNHNPDTDWAIVQAADYEDPYGLPTNPAPASYLEVDDDGSSGSFLVRLTTTYTWYANSDGTGKEFSEDFEADVPVDVTNEPKSATGDSSNTGAVGG